MTLFQFASFRDKLCSLSFTKGTGNLTGSQTLYFYLQARNDCGFNRPSDSIEVDYVTGESIELTIPGDARRDGENIEQFVISVNSVDNAATSKVLINLDAKDLTLPHTLTLSEDTHLLTEVQVTDFPVGTSLLNGMLREWNTTGLVYRYNASSTLVPNGTTVISSLSGNWEYLFDGFTSFVENTTEDSNGSDLSVVDIINPNQILSKYYSLDGSVGPKRSFWIRNDSSETIPQGSRVGLAVDINGEPASEEFESLLKVAFNGFVDTQTGFLDIYLSDGLTPMDDIGVEKDYQFGRTDLILQKPLEPNKAFSLEVFPQFNSYELNGIPQTGTNISVIGFFFDEAGTYNEASALIGNVLLPENPNLRRVYPSSGLSVFADEGSGTIGGFFFKDVGLQTIPGLLDNTDSQRITINNNGSVYIKSTNDLDSNEDLRALVSTLAGESKTSSFSSALQAGINPSLSFTVAYPNQISETYPDVIAGIEGKGVFNAEEIVVYVRKNNAEIRKFEGIAPTNETSDSFTVLWDSGVVVGAVQSTSFGLWDASEPSSITASTTGTDSYEIAVGFKYLGNSVTGISHKESDGCVLELKLTISEMGEKIILLEEEMYILNSRISSLENEEIYWKEPIADYTALKAKTVSSLIEGQTNRVLNTESGKYEIWTWDLASQLASDDTAVIRPDEFYDDSSPGRWLLTSSSGNGEGSLNADQIVTANGQVLVSPDGYVVTSEDGGPIDPNSALDNYTESNVVGGSRIDLTDSLTLTEQTNKYVSLDASDNGYVVNLYDGGSFFFREHIVIHKGSNHTIEVKYEDITIDTLEPGDVLAVLWDTENWTVI